MMSTIVSAIHFGPGEEMQHDTSPHRVRLGDHEQVLQCASLVLCHSRMIYAQLFPVWDRFWCKVFLTDAIVALGGAAGRCAITRWCTAKNDCDVPFRMLNAERPCFLTGTAGELSQTIDVRGSLKPSRNTGLNRSFNRHRIS